MATSPMANSTMSVSVKQCQDIIDYEFKNPHILWEALQMAGNGVTMSGGREVPEGNKRQAVLGDAILSHVLCSRWFADGGTRAEWSARCSAVAGNANLAKVGFALGLEKCLNTISSGQQVSKNTMATAVEAIIAAAYEDGSFPATAVVMKALGLLKVEDDTTLW